MPRFSCSGTYRQRLSFNGRYLAWCAHCETLQCRRCFASIRRPVSDFEKDSLLSWNALAVQASNFLKGPDDENKDALPHGYVGIVAADESSAGREMEIG